MSFKKEAVLPELTKKVKLIALMLTVSVATKQYQEVVILSAVLLKKAPATTLAHAKQVPHKKPFKRPPTVQ